VIGHHNEIDAALSWPNLPPRAVADDPLRPAGNRDAPAREARPAGVIPRRQLVSSLRIRGTEQRSSRSR
jgi:hypothetical protein